MAVAKPIVVRRTGNRGGWHAIQSFALRGVRTRCGVSMPLNKWIIGHGKETTCRACAKAERQCCAACGVTSARRNARGECMACAERRCE